MPLAAGSATLGVQCAAAAGSVDPVGIVAWTAIGGVICAMLPSLAANFSPTKGTPMIAVGPVVSPGGGFVCLPAAPMGLALAGASMSLDAVGIAKWLNIAGVIVKWMNDYGSYGPLGLIGFVSGLPPPGPVTGLGQVTFANEVIGPELAAAAGSTDAVGIAKWTAIGAAILLTVKTYGTIAPGAMVNPGSGGPVAGAGTFS